MKLSIIIPTYDRPRTVIKLVNSLNKQVKINSLRNKVEILVIDDHSKKVNKKIPKTSYIRYFYLDKNRGPSYTRNFGIGKSKGKIIAFIDDDIVVAEDYLTKVIETAKKHPEALIINGHLKKHKDTKYLRLWETLYSETFNRKKGFHKINMLSSGFFQIQRKLLDIEPVLFDNSLLTREDFDLYIRMKGKGIPSFKTDKVIAYNMGRSSLLTLMKQYLHYGRGEYWLRKKHGENYILSFSSKKPVKGHSMLRRFTGIAAKLGYMHERILAKKGSKRFKELNNVMFELLILSIWKRKMLISPKYWVYLIDKYMFNSYFWGLKRRVR